MNALDQAFFKAYGYGEAPAVVSEPVGEGPEVPTEPAPCDATEAATDTQSTCEAEGSAPACSEPEPFQPLLQVDRFSWPVNVTRLCQAAAEPLESLIDDLAGGASQGSNVIALAGCRPGDGATTLLLCLGKRLADHGVRVALVDADFENPRLARRMGILADAGWDDALSQHRPLGEAVIASTHDRLVLVPLADPPEGRRAPSGVPCDPRAMIEVLRRNYDVVLVDIGSCSTAGAIVDAAGNAGWWADRAILVQKRRRAPSSDVDAAVQRLQSTGAEVGIVENFT
ncbi:MAG: hypothetical protein NUV77_18865 [Thermoguttaceae bacterium]|jgi:Mrp family chromosome partitioning ATPase|nr:hypothetical protein [Thermoguttaceae bacterium]